MGHEHYRGPQQHKSRRDPQHLDRDPAREQCIEAIDRQQHAREHHANMPARR